MTGIIGAMEDEIVLLRGTMTGMEVVRIADFEFYSGKIEGKEAVLLRSGIGKVNAAVGCTFLVDRFKPDLVINTGSAGGIDPTLSIGDAIISDGLLHYDADVTGFDYEPGQIPGMPAVFTVPPHLVFEAGQAVEELVREGTLPSGFRHVRGVIGSGDVFVHTSERVNAIRAAFPAVRAVEMEGAAIAQTCFLLKTPAVIIRAVSDIAGAESPISFGQFLPVASKHSAEIVRRMIRNGR
ncbi:MAG: 5'-methylthioadenosine/S-adenosylhomocysteine nucleosidase [Treponema sp.]|jgi:adenosylhomocysteine nucleosidase|nr:5'-methylthioadenosine/S-adenosylhomocysteine nucleosidase [Treponema sp.]